MRMSDYSGHWRRYRRFRNFFIAILLTCLAAVFLLSITSGEIYGDALLLLLYGGLLVSLGVLRLAYWPCPQCSQWFSYWIYYKGLTGRKCFHCDLPKFANQPVPDRIYDLSNRV
jgi:hypothetical protein